MDEFDLFNQTSEPSQNTNNQADDLFGSGNAAPIDTSSNEQQLDPSWATDNDSNKTDILGDDNFASAPPQTTSFADDTLDNFASAPPQASTYDDNMFTDQSNTNELDSFSINNLPPTADNILSNNPSKQSDGSSFDMFSNPASSNQTNQFSSNEKSSTENLSPLQAFNIRRQQEIADKDVVENRKIEELRQQAKQDLERWYQDRQKNMEQKRQVIKHDEEVLRTVSLEKSDKNTCDWAKVVRFLEFSQGTQLSKGKRDLNRMKASMLHAQRDKAGGRKSENGV